MQSSQMFMYVQENSNITSNGNVILHITLIRIGL